MREPIAAAAAEAADLTRHPLARASGPLGALRIPDEHETFEGDGAWKVRDEILNRISFGRLNLYDEARVSLLGHLDVVFCRNVIIYFDDASKKVVVSNFYNRLVDGGYLLLGHSESLISLSTQFKLKHLKNDMVYQK